MPLVRIDLREGTSPDYRNALGDGVQRAMIEAFALPPDDRFQVITEHTRPKASSMIGPILASSAPTRSSSCKLR